MAIDDSLRSSTATTTIGSFPQTKEIRLARSKHTKGELSTKEYETFIENEIKSVVEFQEKIDMDLLVHGEVSLFISHFSIFSKLTLFSLCTG